MLTDCRGNKLAPGDKVVVADNCCGCAPYISFGEIEGFTKHVGKEYIKLKHNSFHYISQRVLKIENTENLSNNELIRPYTRRYNNYN